MTNPDLSFLIPSKAKAYVAILSTVLTLVVPYALEASALLPSPWPLVIGFVIALLGSLGVYKAPYKPTGTILVPETTYDSAPAEKPRVGEFKNPWR